MIRCYTCPLRDVCQIHKVEIDIPTKKEWIPDCEKQKCPLYVITHDLRLNSLLTPPPGPDEIVTKGL